MTTSDTKPKREVQENFVRFKTRSELLQQVPDQWAKQYPKSQYADDTSYGQTRNALLALGIWEKTTERMNAIIGNNGWTQQCCDRCGADSDLLLQIGDEPDYDMRWVDLCPDCIGEIAAMIPK